MSLKGKVAVVTGAASGIGAAIAKRFVADGAKVCLVDVQKELLEKTTAELPAGSAAACVADISSLKDVERMIEATLKLGGKIDILANSAGIDPPEGPGINLDIWHKILEVNLTGPFITMKTIAPLMAKNGGGSIVNIASLAGLRYGAGKTAYVCSKAALIALTQQSAVQYGPEKIRCNVICPAATKTPMFESNSAPLAKSLGKTQEWLYEKIGSFAPLRRVNEPSDIANLCSLLSSEDASALTGAVLIADGGSSLLDPGGVGMKEAFPNWRPGNR
jgi:meso-butanediol dehydrogenase / (S,S)-butanediol dehydrogenase / diacetyl reductase